ncbi:Methyltransferase domain-containing protein [Microbacterium sp. cf046]|uniref:methyltransferase domain-containing protein n=1 Tax=Microbacterium sp. cf046 TaxID=1761803 RepID=UPI0008E66808|nr:class I SAM-dependent methyltransferase [Microbacterium sp. cf046]SFS14832.1 Methyltransferase domain-containing protein [Microbacterium sp. cf046]
MSADDPTAEEFAERMLASALGFADILAAHLGDRLGWYRSLAAHGPTTADELAERTGTDRRYAREWLEQQAVTGVLQVEPGGDDDGRRFRLPAGAAEVLTDDASLNYLAPVARMFGAVGPALPDLLDAYRTGGGVSWADFGADAREGQADLNRPWFRELPKAFAEVDDIQSVLTRPGARIADIGTGAGWSSIALAQAYPELRVDGFDIDDPSIELARANAQDAGVSDRVRFHNADGDGLSNFGRFDAAFAFECIHDMPRPVEVLAAMRLAVRDDGPVIVMDEAVAETFTAPGDDLERIMYAYSLFVCLPDSLSHRPSVGTGTVMRPETLRGYAREAGFADLEILPIEDFAFFRFYSLTR